MFVCVHDVCAWRREAAAPKGRYSVQAEDAV